MLLAVLFVATAILTAAVLFEVLGTVFFAITVGYVLLPFRRELVDRGVPKRIAAAVVTTAAFLAVVALLSPVAFVLYERRSAILGLIRALPNELPVGLLGFEFVVETAPLLVAARDALQGYAVSFAAAAPVIGLKLFLFAFLVYALLLRPEDGGRAIFELAPRSYHDVIVALHRRVRRTLYAIYVVQAATAVATFAVAYALFVVLGYETVLALAVVAGILQFVPIIGPSVLIAVLALSDVMLGTPVRGVTVLVLGLLLVGFLPDAVVRPKLAGRTANVPASLYFIGFTGGVLTAGPVGIIAGPVVVGVFVEVITLLAADMTTLSDFEGAGEEPE